MLRLVDRFIADERGLETVEWAVLAALVVAGVATVVGTIGPKIAEHFGDMGAVLGE